MSGKLYDQCNASEINVWSDSDKCQTYANGSRAASSDLIDDTKRMLIGQSIDNRFASRLFHADYSVIVLRETIATIEAHIVNNFGAKLVSERVGFNDMALHKLYAWKNGSVFMHCESYERIYDEDETEPVPGNYMRTDDDDDEVYDDDEEDTYTIKSATKTRIYIATNNRQDITDIANIVKQCVLPARKQVVHENPGWAYVLANIPLKGLSITNVGLSGIKLVRENYSTDVLAAFDKTVSDLTRSDPSGRLTLLEGPPGTGKTYLVRALMNAVSNSKFVIVPPHLVASLSDPNLILTFLNEMDSGIGPIILVLEDADTCLSQRKAENMNSISSILNLSDGIIGSLLDLRIVATTNTPASEFDPALLRKGRMSAHMKIDKLNSDHIIKIWNRIAGNKIELPVPIESINTVAEVYSAYNELPEHVKALAAATL